MSRERQNRRFRVAFAICMVLGLAEVVFLMVAQRYFRGGLGQTMLEVLLCIGLAVLVGMAQWFFPYAVVALGLAKLREQRREELEALGDDNKVIADPDGERKLHDYLTAITSTEARIGLLQRSAPFPPPAALFNRPLQPLSRKPRQAKYSWLTWLFATMLVGWLIGAAMVQLQGLGTDLGVLAIWTVIWGAFMAVFVSPLGLLLGLIFGRTGRRPTHGVGSNSAPA